MKRAYSYQFSWRRLAAMVLNLVVVFFIVDLIERDFSGWTINLMLAIPFALLWYLVQHGRQLNERPVVGEEGIGVNRHLGKSFLYAPENIRRVIIRRMIYGFGRPHDILQIHGKDGQNRRFALSDLREANNFRQQVEQLAAAHEFPLRYQNAAGEVVDGLDELARG